MVQLTNEKLEEAKALYKKTNNLTLVSKSIGVSAPTLKSILQRNGITVGRKNKEIVGYTDKLKMAVDMYTDGKSSVAIGKHLGISSSTVLRAVRDAGLPVVYKSRMSKTDIDEAVELYNAGHGSIYIGKKLGYSFNCVLKTLKKSGVVIREIVDYGMGDEDKLKAIELYTSGLTTYEVGAEVGYSHQTIINHLRNSGCKLRERNLKKNSLLVDNVIRLYKKYGSASRVADEVGLCGNTVLRILHDNNIEIKWTKLSDGKEEKAIELYKDRYTSSEIAEYLEISSSSVLNILKRNGITRVRRGRVGDLEKEK